MFPLRDSIPVRTVSFITWTIIALNCAVFLLELSLEPDMLDPFVKEFGFVPSQLSTHTARLGLLSVFSAMFMHGGWGHLLGNMWFLHIFGNNIEDRLGHMRYLFLYLVTGCGAAFLQFIIAPASPVPMIGASGAISGVLGAYLVFYPRSTVTTFIPLGLFSRIIEVPAAFYLGIWFLMQLLTGVSSLGGAEAQAGGVAFFAHVGGFVAGLLLCRLLDPGERNSPPRYHYSDYNDWTE